MASLNFGCDTAKTIGLRQEEVFAETKERLDLIFSVMLTMEVVFAEKKKVWLDYAFK